MSESIDTGDPSYRRCPWCGSRFEHNCDPVGLEDQPGEIYLIVATSGEYSNKRLYVLEWFAVRETATERAAELATLDDLWRRAWSSQYNRDLSFNEQYDFEMTTLAAARAAMRDPHWIVPSDSYPTNYQVHALRCGADTFEHLERTAGSIMKALKGL